MFFKSRLLKRKVGNFNLIQENWMLVYWNWRNYQFLSMT